MTRRDSRNQNQHLVLRRNPMSLQHYPIWQAMMSRETAMSLRMHMKRKLQTSKRNEKKYVVPFGTDCRCNNPHADETWLCGRLWHRRLSKSLKAFAREILECGDADSVDFGGTALSTAARVFWGLGQLLQQRAGVAHETTRSRVRTVSETIFNASVFSRRPMRYEIVEENEKASKNIKIPPLQNWKKE